MKPAKMKILPILLSAAVLVCVLFTGCSSGGDEYRDYSYFAMDTYITIRLAYETEDSGRLSDEYLDSVAEKCEEILARIDLAISAHNPKSDVYALNTDINKMLSADEDLLAILETSDKIHSLTDGVFDYSLGALTELWNVTKGGPVPDSDAITEAMSHTGIDKFSVSGKSVTKLDPKAKLDFGGIGKGIAAQRLLEYLSTTDVAYGVVSLGGNIGVFGEKPGYGSYKIGLRDPDNQDNTAAYFYLTSGFVSVSGDYERYFEENGVRYHHIIDPRTGYPADSGLRSVAVHTANGALSDALSTALFILGEEKSMELYESGSLDFEAVFITAEGETVYTPGLEGRFEIVTGE